MSVCVAPAASPPTEKSVFVHTRLSDQAEPLAMATLISHLDVRYCLPPPPFLTW